MDSITLQNYRCFGSEEQTARLAPLTLLVGPNSTGKTSFLALIRALWDVAFREVVPNFREEPFDLGSFENIVHDNGARDAIRASFTAGFSKRSPSLELGEARYKVDFADRNGSPYPVARSLDRNEARWTVTRLGELDHLTMLSTSNGTWRYSIPVAREDSYSTALIPHPISRWETFARLLVRDGDDQEAQTGSGAALHDDRDLQIIMESSIDFRKWGGEPRPFAGSPVRSRPRRTYDPMLLAHDVEGDSIPSYLANVSRRAADEWQRLKGGLEDFGRTSGLFDEISVRSFGKSDGDPFQIQMRKFGKRRKGPWRNLIDVGYGVSQALPVLTELLRPDAPLMFLLQQPEVHLHPQAQAALGTLFCEVAAGGRQLVVETHSDYIIDRVRMDVRDQTTGLKPEDVSILYFEPRDLDVKIHSIRLDEMGNVLDAPASYGRFFMDEINRSIGLVKPDVRDSR